MWNYIINYLRVKITYKFENWTPWGKHGRCRSRRIQTNPRKWFFFMHCLSLYIIIAAEEHYNKNVVINLLRSSKEDKLLWKKSLAGVMSSVLVIYFCWHKVPALIPISIYKCKCSTLYILQLESQLIVPSSNSSFILWDKIRQ